MGPKRMSDEILVHQISLPARRDYQLRSYSSPLNSDFPKPSNPVNLVACAFQNARALSFNASHNDQNLPYALENPRLGSTHRSFYSGPLIASSSCKTSALMADYDPAPGATGAVATAHYAHNPGDTHAPKRSESSDASFGTADSVTGQYSDDQLSERSLNQERELLPDPPSEVRKELSIDRKKEPSIFQRAIDQKNQVEMRAEESQIPAYTLTPRRALSGDLRESISRFESRGQSVELMRAASSRVMGNRISARSGELITRASSRLSSNLQNRSSDRSSDEHTTLSSHQRGGPVTKKKKNPQSATPKVMNDGPERREIKGSLGKTDPRYESASLGWESVSKSQDKLAAIPFKWEEVPGKPISNSIAVAAERAMAKRFLREFGHKGRTSGGESDSPLQTRGPTRRIAQSTKSPTLCSEEDSADEIVLRRGVVVSPTSSSFRGSHRFYARTVGEGSFGPRKSVEGAHIISEVESNAQIDLVAPAAAKFLVESWVSPGNITPEPNLASSTIPFRWEEAPGIPKLDGSEADIKSSSKPIQLQLPPRLVTPPPPVAMSKGVEKRGRQQTRSMSGPLAGYCSQSSPSRTSHQAHHSPPVMRRSCSPSKRSISPSRIQALAKHFSRKSSTPPVEFSRENSRTYHDHNNSGPLGGFDRYRSGRSCSSNRVIGRSGRSGVMLSEMAYCTAQDGDLPHSSSGPQIIRNCASGPLDYGGNPKRRHSSPAQRSSVSPSRRIHTLAKQLISKIGTGSSSDQMTSAAAALDQDLSWPISIKQVQRQHSFTRLQSTVLLFRENFNGGAASDENNSEEGAEPTSSSSRACGENRAGPWSPSASILQSSNDPSGADHFSGSVPSSGRNESDQCVNVATPVSDVGLSKSLSRISYESFEHSFAERDESQSSRGEQDAGGVSPPLGAPYLGPTSGDYQVRKPTVGAAEGVKAIVKMCRSGSTWRKSKTHSPEMWAPTLASYFQCLEAATLSNPVNAHVTTTTTAATTTTSTQSKHLEGEYNHGVDEGSSSQHLAEPTFEAQTRLPYTMPASHVEQNLTWTEHCNSPKGELRTCLGLKLSPARFVTRGSHGCYADTVTGWSQRHSLPTNTVEDGYRSPGYAATLELLSPSVELFRKKRRVLGSSRGFRFILPSADPASMRRKTHLVEAMCKSVKRALYKCAKRCCRKTVRNEEPGLPQTEFSFYKVVV